MLLPLRGLYAWTADNLKWRSLWKLYSASVCIQAAASFAKPFVLVAVMTTLACGDAGELSDYCTNERSIQHGQRVVAFGTSITNLIAAVATFANLVMMGHVSRKTMLLWTYVNPAVVYALMFVFCGRSLGKWSALVYYLSCAISGCSPKATRIISTVWLDVTDGNDDRRGQMVILRRAASAFALGISKPVAIFALRNAIFDAKFVFLGLCGLAGIGCGLAKGLHIPDVVKETPNQYKKGQGSWRSAMKIWRICTQSRLTFWMIICEAIVKSCEECQRFQLIAFGLAVHRWRQGSLMFASMATGICLVPVVGVVLSQSRKFGECRVWAVVTVMAIAGSVVSKFLMAQQPLFMVLLVLFLGLRGPVLESITETAKARFPQYQPGTRGPVQACVAILTKIFTAIFTIATTNLFNASATRYFDQTLPFAVLAIIEVISFLAFKGFVWRDFARQLDLIHDERTRKNSEATGRDQCLTLESKKTD